MRQKNIQAPSPPTPLVLRTKNVPQKIDVQSSEMIFIEFLNKLNRGCWQFLCTMSRFRTNMWKISRAAHVSREKVNGCDYLRGSHGLLLFKIISKILNNNCCNVPTKIMYFILLLPTINDLRYILMWNKHRNYFYRIEYDSNLGFWCFSGHTYIMCSGWMKSIFSNLEMLCKLNCKYARHI